MLCIASLNFSSNKHRVVAGQCKSCVEITLLPYLFIRHWSADVDVPFEKFMKLCIQTDSTLTLSPSTGIFILRIIITLCFMVPYRVLSYNYAVKNVQNGRVPELNDGIMVLRH